MNEIMTTVFGLAGGLAMFLFGMNSMSDALQKAAGERMKQILSFLTKIQLWAHWQVHWSPPCCKAPRQPQLWLSASSAPG